MITQQEWCEMGPARRIRYGSVCSGIESGTVGLDPLGWELAWLAEIAPFPCRVLAHRYPGVRNLGDMTTIAPRVLSGEVEAPDVLVGGTPCQSFSISGLRDGLADPRGQLTLSYVKQLDTIDSVRSSRGQPPAACLWENVTGVLSDQTNAFGWFIAGLAGEPEPLLPPDGRRWPNAGVVAGPKRTVVWRVLDAQYLGVPQRRRRVFVVAGAGADVERVAEVLLEPAGLPGDPAQGGEPREDASSDAGARPGGDHPIGIVSDETVAVGKMLTSGTGSRPASEDERSGAVPTAQPIVYENHGQDSRITECGAVAPTVHAKYGTGGNNVPLVQCSGTVRRLTPVECERLQGLPDGYTDIPGARDGPRYKALGNSFAVPVVRWICERLNTLLLESPRRSPCAISSLLLL